MDRALPLPLCLAAAEPLRELLPCHRALHRAGGRMGNSQGEGATGKGSWQSVLHSPSFRGQMSWEEGVCWQPDSCGCGDLQRRLCWQLPFPLLLQMHPQTDLLSSPCFPLQHKHSHVPGTASCVPPRQETSAHRLCSRVASLCSGISWLQKNSDLRRCMASTGEQELHSHLGHPQKP